MDRLSDAWHWWTTGRATALVAFLALAVAATTATVAVRTLRQTRRDSKSKARPMVAAELRAVPYTEGNQSLIIRNYGPSIARNVRVEFDPPISEPADPTGLGTPYMLKRFSKPIPVMTPGMELDNLYYTGEHDSAGGGRWVNIEPVPDQVTVRITYSSDDGDPYVGEFPLNVEVIRGRTFVQSSRAPEQQAKAVLKSLREITAVLKNIADSGALMTRDQRQERTEEMRRQRAEWAALPEKRQETPLARRTPPVAGDA